MPYKKATWSQNKTILQIDSFTVNNTFNFRFLEVNINDYNKKNGIPNKIKNCKQTVSLAKNNSLLCCSQKETRSSSIIIHPILLYSEETWSSHWKGRPST